MQFRKAVPEDIPSIAGIYSEIHDAEENRAPTIGWIRNIYPTEVTARKALDRSDLFVMETDGVVVGAAVINQLQDDAYDGAPWQFSASPREVMVLHTLVIPPRLSGRGYGSAFVRFYEEYARQNGCFHLRMDTNAINLPARSLYRKLGYCEIGVVPCVFNGIDGVQLVLLEKNLRPLSESAKAKDVQK